MLSWVQENRAEYLESYSDIGEDLESVEDLEEDHKQFEANCVVNLACIINDNFSGKSAPVTKCMPISFES